MPTTIFGWFVLLVGLLAIHVVPTCYIIFLTLFFSKEDETTKRNAKTSIFDPFFRVCFFGIIPIIFVFYLLSLKFVENINVYGY